MTDIFLGGDIVENERAIHRSIIKQFANFGALFPTACLRIGIE
jgi:hypothetical protein